MSHLWHCCSNCQDGCLWWVDDGCKLLDAKHAQVADGEGAAHEVRRLQLVLLGLQRTRHSTAQQGSAYFEEHVMTTLTPGARLSQSFFVSIPRRTKRQPYPRTPSQNQTSTLPMHEMQAY